MIKKFLKKFKSPSSFLNLGLSYVCLHAHQFPPHFFSFFLLLLCLWSHFVSFRKNKIEIIFTFVTRTRDPVYPRLFHFDKLLSHKRHLLNCHHHRLSVTFNCFFGPCSLADLSTPFWSSHIGGHSFFFDILELISYNKVIRCLKNFFGF